MFQCSLYGFLVFCLSASNQAALGQTRVVFARAFGATEQMPPVIMLTTSTSPFGGNTFGSNPASALNSPQGAASTPDGFTLGSQRATVEFDVFAEAAPNLALVFVHCDPFWREDDNPFVSDPTQMRTSLVDVQPAPPMSRRYTYRARATVPNTQMQFRHSGNWKAKLVDTHDPRTALGEVRLFVVEPLASCRLDLIADLYVPKAQGAGNGAYTIECGLQAPPELSDSQITTMVLYRNHRWFEPIAVSDDDRRLPTEWRTNLVTNIFGSAQALKRFRVEKVPAQNEYRVLELRNNAWYPDAGIAIRFPTADLRRIATFSYQADDGALLSTTFSTSSGSGSGGSAGGSTTTNSTNGDEYVNVEFVLDPLPVPSRYDVYVVGTFNGWRTGPEWKMQYNTQQRLYTLRQWVRRARHNYLYASGFAEAGQRSDDGLTFEEFEGNALSSLSTFLAFTYFRDPSFGGYDRIIGVAARSPTRR
jgi:hypothetical protein